MGANVYVRFLQQSELFKVHGHPVRGDDPKNRRLCIASLVVGWLSALGLSMVANFQVIYSLAFLITLVSPTPVSYTHLTLPTSSYV